MWAFVRARKIWGLFFCPNLSISKIIRIFAITNKLSYYAIFFSHSIRNIGLGPSSDKLWAQADACGKCRNRDAGGGFIT